MIGSQICIPLFPWLEHSKGIEQHGATYLGDRDRDLDLDRRGERDLERRGDREYDGERERRLLRAKYSQLEF